MKERSVWRRVIGGIFSFIVFLILLAVANYVSPWVGLTSFSEIVKFFNANIGFIFLMSAVFILSDIFWALIFPFNIPAPIVSAVGGILIVDLMFGMFKLIEYLLDVGIYTALGPFREMIYGLVFWLTIIVGYIIVVFRARGKLISEDNSKKIKDRVEWEDVGEEFKLALYEFAGSLNRIFSKKKDKRR